MTISVQIPWKKLFKWLLVIMAVFFILVLACGLAVWQFEKKHKDRIYPGIFVGKIDLGGKTPAEAKKLLDEKINNFNTNGITFVFDNSSVPFLPVVSSLESDLAYELVTYDTERTVLAAYKIGRHGNFARKLIDHAEMYLHPKSVDSVYTIHEGQIREFLKGSFSKLESPAENAKLSYENINGKIPFFSVQEEKYGQIIEYDRGIDELKDKLRGFDFSPIELMAKVDYPVIYKKFAYSVDEKAKELYVRAPIEVYYGDLSWKIEKEEFAGLLGLEINGDKEVVVGLDDLKIKAMLSDKAAEKINKAPVDAKFEIKDGKVMEFQASQDGFELDPEASISVIEEGLKTGTSTRFELAVKSLKSKLETQDINDLGIKEVIGTGHSNFAGSPKNRRHNIAVGAASVNGTLLKPGDEFSLLKVLGNIDKEGGYLPELVIKENRTVPEYGGGLCQIGTTVFRATIQSGLPVTMRRNHSYRVSYYEPAGTDATIYSPWPDYKFVNDTSHHILIQSRIEGDDLYFDFWGTKDGRKIEITEPTIYNIVKPGPTKLIETADLKPGEKKCTEKAHNGADAYFDYTVAYSKDAPPAKIKTESASGAAVNDEDLTIKTRFSSHYVPWREVCLVGIDPNVSGPNTQTGSSTEAVIAE